MCGYVLPPMLNYFDIREAMSFMKILRGMIKGAIATRGDYEFGDSLPKTGGIGVPSKYEYLGTYLSLYKNEKLALEVYSYWGLETWLIFVCNGRIVASASVSDMHTFKRTLGGVYVSGIKVNDDYRSRGVGISLYFILMDLYGVVIGDLSQAEGARRVWKSLSKYGNVAILDSNTGKILKKNYKVTDTLDPAIWVDEYEADDPFISEKTSYTAINIRLGLLSLNSEGKKAVRRVRES